MARQRRSGVPLHQVYVPEEFKNRRPPTEEIRIAMENHLAAHGRKLSGVPKPLPPKAEAAGPQKRRRPGKT
jgi:hypothetical protein